MLKSVRKENIYLTQADLNNCLPFSDETFDLVTCCGVLEFIYHHESSIDELTRVTKREGIVAFTAEIAGIGEDLNIEIAPQYNIYRVIWSQFMKQIASKYEIIGKNNFVAYQRPNLSTGKKKDVLFGGCILRKE
ncbi:MAG: class I SAM-dependent methyltransferase [Nanoarchaeota archaeon]